MRYYSIFIFVILLAIQSPLPASIQSTDSRYERRLHAFGIEESNGKNIVSFILDNEWTFKGQVDPLEINKLFSLENLLETRVQIIGNRINLQGLEFILECPINEGIEKMNFLVSPTFETYAHLPTVTSVEIIDAFFFQHVIVSLSDGSSWDLVSSLSMTHATKYWSEGDRVLVTKRFSPDQGTHLLVNLDISGEYFYSRYYYQTLFTPRTDRFAIEDPRNLSACLE